MDQLALWRIADGGWRRRSALEQRVRQSTPIFHRQWVLRAEDVEQIDHLEPGLLASIAALHYLVEKAGERDLGIGYIDLAALEQSRRREQPLDIGGLTEPRQHLDRFTGGSPIEEERRQRQA